MWNQQEDTVYSDNKVMKQYLLCILFDLDVPKKCLFLNLNIKEDIATYFKMYECIVIHFWDEQIFFLNLTM